MSTPASIVPEWYIFILIIISILKYLIL
jgi:hypothetical protein